MESKRIGFLLKKNECIDTVKEVWAANVEHEMSLMYTKMNTHPMIGLDTEFPGFLKNRPISSPEDLRYEDLAFNVNSLKLIQLGLTLFNEKGEIGGCWQINFSGFDVNNDNYVLESIQLLGRNGIDFERNRLHGVDPDIFAEKFNEVLSRHRGRTRWVTFHGIYDVAYLSKLLIKRDIPASKYEFVNMVCNAMGGVLYDVKLMVGERGYLGLQRMSEEFSVERVGQAHQAGPDSLLIAKLFLKLSQGVNNSDLVKFRGYLFGISFEIGSRVVGQVETSRIQSTPEIERPAIELLPCIQGECYPCWVFGSQGYYMASSGCYPLVPSGPWYHIPVCPFYPTPIQTRTHNFRTPMWMWKSYGDRNLSSCNNSSI